MIWHWDIASNRAECKQVCRGHERGLDCVSVSPNKEKIATGAWDNMLKIWSACKLFTIATFFVANFNIFSPR